MARQSSFRWIWRPGLAPGRDSLGKNRRDLRRQTGVRRSPMEPKPRRASQCNVVIDDKEITYVEL